jgi:hypothetical protein
MYVIQLHGVIPLMNVPPSRRKQLRWISIKRHFNCTCPQNAAIDWAGIDNSNLTQWPKYVRIVAELACQAVLRPRKWS